MPTWSFLNFMPDAILVVGRDGLIVQANELAEQSFGWPPGGLVGVPVERLVPAGGAEQHARLREGFFAAPRTRTMGEGRVLHAARQDGSLFLVEISLSFVEEEGRGVAICVVRDISERLRLGARLKLQQAALEASANAILLTDRGGHISWANPAFSRLTGYSLDELRGQNPRVLRSGLHDEAFYASLWRTVLAGEVWHGEVVNRRKDGSLYVEEQTITPVADEQGQITHFVAIKQDVTEKRRAAGELQRQLDYLAALHSMTLGLLSREPSANRGMLEEFTERAAQLLAQMPQPGGEAAWLLRPPTERPPTRRPSRPRPLAAPGLAEDLEEARDFVRKTLPEPPAVEGLEIDVVYQPLEVVGGDLYQMSALGPSRLRVFLADTTGHGVRASLTAILVLSEYDLVKGEASPARVLEALNERLSTGFGHLGVRLTAVCVDIDTAAGTVCCASAAHPAPLLVRRGGVVELGVPGSFIGLVPGLCLLESTLALDPDDLLLLYTDGVTDGEDAQGKSFGDERLHEAASEAARQPRPPGAFVFSSILDFMGQKGALGDDLTLLALRFRPWPAP